MAIKIVSFTLADGSTQKALVPKVYTRQAVGQIDGTGSDPCHQICTPKLGRF
ncbi:hypothetical protein [Psychrobacter phenylpyruvicus]|uniref:hypothetical protein n=1 Tax=Psychrobacter phenylpyruvicus TaxID=29432 RepID=UPI000AEF3468|nr:hypothetical protein [Psychrobacter phenylpyruvicus]